MAKEEFEIVSPTFTVNYYSKGEYGPIAQVDHISLGDERDHGETGVFSREWVAAAGAVLLVDAEAMPLRSAQSINRIDLESDRISFNPPADPSHIRVRAAAAAFSDLMTASGTTAGTRDTIQQLDAHWMTRRHEP